MELLAAAIVWPLLILLVGLVFLALGNASLFFIFPAFVLFVIVLASFRDKDYKTDYASQLEHLRRVIVIFSIAILLPLFMRYVMDISGSVLPIMIGGLFLGFALVIWGIFVQDHKVLTFANVLGGAFIIIYLYGQLWSLGQLPRIIAAAFGLLMAVVVSVIKLKDKIS